MDFSDLAKSGEGEVFYQKTPKGYNLIALSERDVKKEAINTMRIVKVFLKPGGFSGDKIENLEIAKARLGSLSGWAIKMEFKEYDFGRDGGIRIFIPKGLTGWLKGRFKAQRRGASKIRVASPEEAEVKVARGLTRLARELMD